MTATSVPWQVRGEYFETCSCEYLCPCTPGNLAGMMPRGECTFAMVFHIEEGALQHVRLDGLHFAVIGHAPHETMAMGDLSVGVITDDRASEEQRDALVGIASGQAGGPMAALGPLVKAFLGSEAHHFELQHDGLRRHVRIDDCLTQGVQGIPGRDDQQPLYLENTNHPVASRLGLGTATESELRVFGLEWSNRSGTNNGHLAPFSWSG